MMPLVSALSFDADRHEYRFGDQLVPSVTQILHATGVATDFEELAALGPRISLAIGYKRALGTAVHADCHAFDDHDLDASADERVQPYLQAWATFRENLHVEPEARERRVFNPLYFYAGTLDGVFRIGPKRVLIDIKIGDPEDAGAAFQTAAYEAAYLIDHPDDLITERWAVQLLPDRRVPYAITNYSARAESWRDFTKFQCFVTTYGEQAVRRRR